MKKNITFLLLFLCASLAKASDTSLETYIHNFPLLICYSDEYRGCYHNLDVKSCALEVKQHRDQCESGMGTGDSNASLVSNAKCLVVSHAGANNLEAIESACVQEKGMNINITKNSAKLNDADPVWVQQILE